MIFTIQVYRYYEFEAESPEEAQKLIDSDQIWDDQEVDIQPVDESPPLDIFYINEEFEHISLSIPEY